MLRDHGTLHRSARTPHGGTRWAVVLVLLLCAWAMTGEARAAGPSAKLAAAIDDAGTPDTLCPGEPRQVTLTLHNTGGTDWEPAARDRISYHWVDASGAMVVRDGERTELPRPVLRGESITLPARVRAPEQPGRYRLRWALVRELRRWVETGSEGVEVEVLDAGPALAWSRRSGGVPGPLRGGEDTTVELRLRNEGCATWSPEAPDLLSYRWYDGDGRLEVDQGQRTPLPPLAPGQEATVTAQLRAPPRAGAFFLEWVPVREHLSWFPPDPSVIAIEVGPSPWAFSLALPEPLVAMSAGEHREVEVRLEHQGDEEWSGDGGDSLGYRWFDQTGAVVADGPRTRLPSPLLPGDAVLLSLRINAPPGPGRYRLDIQPVREGVRWFATGSTPAAARWIEVGPRALSWALVEVQPPRARWARRTDDLRVVVRNTGAEGWSPELGDRLSYRWYDAEDGTLVSDGIRTPVPHAVAPGQEVVFEARVRGPDEPGRFVLALEMIREHVRWYGPPSEGQARLPVRVERWSSYWVALLGAAGAFVVIVLRRRAFPPGLRWWLWRIGPALWMGAAVLVLSHCFVDLSGAEPWDDAWGVLLGPGALLALVVLPLSPRVQAWLGVAALLLLTLMALADLAYLHFFGSIVPLTAMLAVHHLADAEATVSSLLRPAYGWLIALPGLGLALAASWPGRSRGPAPARPRRRLVLVALVLALAAVPLGLALGRAYAKGIDERVFSEQDNVGRLGVVGAHLFQLLRGIDDWLGPEPLTPEQRDALARTLASHRAARAEARARAPGFGAARGYDVIIVQAEALQQWVIGARVQGQPIVPFLERSAADDALYFDQVFDQTAQGRTSDAEYLVLGAGHPPSRGALAFLYEDDDFYTLAHVLAERGYSTASAHPYARGFWNRARLHPRYGFETSSFRRELGSGPTIGWGLSDAAFFERMLPRMLEAPSPSFTFLITLSLHHPYEEFPPALAELELGSLEGTAVGNYLQAMRHLDGAMAELMAGLQRAGRADRTLVVLYGDHVTGLGEPTEILALAGRATWDPAAHTELHRVPLLMWVGDSPPASLRGRHSTVGGQIDIGPTVLHLLGIEDPRPAALGRTLLDPQPGFAALSSGGAVDDQRAFAATGQGIPRTGGCFERPTGHSLPLVECEPLIERASRERTAARQVLVYDLHRTEPSVNSPEASQPSAP